MLLGKHKFCKANTDSCQINHISSTGRGGGVGVTLHIHGQEIHGTVAEGSLSQALSICCPTWLHSLEALRRRRTEVRDFICPIPSASFQRVTVFGGL